MISPLDQFLSTVWYITCTYWMRVWMISQVLSMISVLPCLIFPYTNWKRMILQNDPRLSTVWHIGCTFWMFVRMIWTVLYIMCYSTSHVPIHIENEWSTFINSMLNEIYIYIWVFEWMISSVFSSRNVLSWLTCPYTPRKRMILPTGRRLSTIIRMLSYLSCPYTL